MELIRRTEASHRAVSLLTPFSVPGEAAPKSLESLEALERLHLEPLCATHALCMHCTCTAHALHMHMRMSHVTLLNAHP